MYYNRELFINEKIKAKYTRLNEWQIFLILSITILAMVIAIAVILTVGVKYPDTFMRGYVMAIFGSVLFVILFAILLPFQRKLDLLRNKQAEELKGQSIHEKYIELINLGQKSNKISNSITITSVIISVIAVWVLAVIFPYGYYNVFAFVLPIVTGKLILATQQKRIKQIQDKEKEIATELRKNTTE